MAALQLKKKLDAIVALVWLGSTKIKNKTRCNYCTSLISDGSTTIGFQLKIKDVWVMTRSPSSVCFSSWYDVPGVLSEWHSTTTEWNQQIQSSTVAFTVISATVFCSPSSYSFHRRSFSKITFHLYIILVVTYCQIHALDIRHFSLSLNLKNFNSNH